MAAPDPKPPSPARGELARSRSIRPASSRPSTRIISLPQIVWLVDRLRRALLADVAHRPAPRRLDPGARSARIDGDLDDAAPHAGAGHGRQRGLRCQTLAEAKARAQALAQQTHDELHAETRPSATRSRPSSTRKLAAAESQIADTKTRAMGNVEGIARDAAAAIVEHLTGKPAEPRARSTPRSRPPKAS